MRRNEVHGAAVPAVNISKLGIADADGFLQHRLEHRLQIAGELLMTCSTSAVAVCCSRTVRSTVRWLRSAVR